MKPRPQLWFFLLPGLCAYVFFKLLPLAGAFALSLTEWTGLNATIKFIGIANYKEMIADIGFQKALTNNLKFALTIIIFQTLVSLGMALLVVRNTRWNVALRALFFTPMIISSVSVAFIWTFMYDTNIGAVNMALRAIGAPGLVHSWLGEAKLVLYSLAFVQIWTNAGQLCVIFVAGLQTIPESLYEAAAMEGAGVWQTFRHVTWPLLAPATAVVVTLITIGSFKVFDLIWVMTQGGPGKASDILSTFIYTQAFGFFRFGYASTASVFFMMIIAAITTIQFRLLRAREVTYQ